MVRGAVYYSNGLIGIMSAYNIFTVRNWYAEGSDSFFPDCGVRPIISLNAEVLKGKSGGEWISNPINLE